VKGQPCPANQIKEFNMAGDYGSGQGGVQTSTSTEFAPHESGTPKTGFSSAPKGECHRGGPGEGIPASNRKIR
jgi:hypothetical protein